MATAQINARIQPAVKESGDRGLESIGYSPTRAIRALWSYVGENRHERRKLLELFRTLEGKSAQGAQAEAEAAERARRAEQAPAIFEKALAELGVTQHHLSDLAEEELMEQAFIEKMAERGTLS